MEVEIPAILAAFGVRHSYVGFQTAVGGLARCFAIHIIAA